MVAYAAAYEIHYSAAYFKLQLIFELVFEEIRGNNKNLFLEGCAWLTQP